MGQKDIAMRNFLHTEEIYMDFLENFIFKNRIRLTKDMVFEQNGKQVSFIKTKDKRLLVKEKERDLFFLVKENIKEHPELEKFLSSQGELACLIIGIEGQNDLSNIMPVRIMFYDALSYEHQIKTYKKAHKEKGDLDKDDFLSGIHKDEKLIPLVSIVFYYGEEPWNRSRSLFDMMNLEALDSDILNMIQDYRINLVDIHDISDFSSFKSALGPVIELMKIRKNKNEIKSYINTHQEFLSEITEETFDLIAEIVDSKWLSEQKNVYEDRNGGVYNMCTGMKDWLEEVEQNGISIGIDIGRSEGIDIGRSEGIDIGRSEGIDIGRSEGINIAKRIMKALCEGMSESEVASLCDVSISEVLVFKGLMAI